MIRLMELTMNQANMNLGNANAEWGSTGWRMPEFGFQKYVAEAVKSIFHTIHSSSIITARQQPASCLSSWSTPLCFRAF